MRVVVIASFVQHSIHLARLPLPFPIPKIRIINLNVSSSHPLSHEDSIKVTEVSSSQELSSSPSTLQIYQKALPSNEINPQTSFKPQEYRTIRCLGRVNVGVAPVYHSITADTAAKDNSNSQLSPRATGPANAQSFSDYVLSNSPPYQFNRGVPEYSK